MSSNIKIITLQSKDGNIISILSNIASCSVLLKDLLEDLGDAAVNQPILIPEIEAEVITDIFNWCEKYYDQDFTNSKTNSREIENSLIFKETQCLKQSDICKLFRIIEAANYLDIGNLLNTSYENLAFIISDIDLNETQWSTLTTESFQLTNELYDELLKTLSQYNRHSYLKYLTRVPYLPGQANANRIKEAIALDIGISHTLEDYKPQDILKYFVNGWDTKDLTWDVFHSKIAYPCNIPGWNGMGPTSRQNEPFIFITDGFHILLGTGSKNTSNLMIYNILDGKRTVINATELARRGWPQLSNPYMSSIAFHSGLIIVGFTLYTGAGLGEDDHDEMPRCFQLSTSPLRITWLNTPQPLYDMTEDNCFAINEEFICVSESYPHKLFVYNRDFVLKGYIQVYDSIQKIIVKGKTIITLEGDPFNKSLYFWELKDTNNPETSLKHIKTISLKGIYDNSSKLILSYNLDLTIITGNRCIYFAKSKADNPDIKSLITNMSCVDELSGQYYAAYNIEHTSKAKIIKFQISNLCCLEKKKSIAISVPLELGVLLDCKMYFTTFILFFTSGIARVRVKEHESIYRIIASNSGGKLSLVEADPKYFASR